MASPTWTTWRPRLLYAGFFLLAFLLSLRLTFPAAAVKQRLIVEAAQRGWQLDAEEVGGAGVLGVGLRQVTLKDQSGLAIPLEAAQVTLRLWPLLRGRRSIAFDARLYDGRVRGTADLDGDPQRFTAAVEGVDLARALPLRKASGLELLGVASGSADVTLPAGPQGKANGRVELAVQEAGVNGGKLSLPGLPGGLTVPKASLGEVKVALQVVEGKATFEALGAAGGDLELRANGLYFQVQPKLEFASLFGRLRLKPSEPFLARPENRALRPLLDGAMGMARGGDGAYELQVYGTVGHPQLRPLAAAGRAQPRGGVPEE